MATTELSKTYEPASIEAAAYQVWTDEKCFHPDAADPGQPYSIVIPPPNVTGALHLGHAINNTLQDILTRVHRMRGFNALWVPGLDHAGIATQAVVEKQLKEKENKTRHDVGREGLVERIWAWKQQYGDRIVNQLKRLGCSCDWDRTRFTLDDMCAKAVRETFFKLFKDGLIYRGKRLVNWDVQLQTSISDDEIYHETVQTHLWHIKYPIDGTVKFMTVATTRPETMLGDTAVAVHSEDPRWNWAIGKFVKLPLTDRLIPIIADDILVDPKFGSGVVKVTPAHDPNDYAVWTRHQGKPDQIDILNILNPDGTLNDAAGAKYKGLTINKARHATVNDLKELGLLVKEEPYETQVGHSDRSKTPIQPYLSDQWFVKMAPLAEPALDVVRDGTIKFFPERHAQQYLSWLGEKRDWPISRQLWWGHRIPVWSRDGLIGVLDGLDDECYFRDLDAKKTYCCLRIDRRDLIESLERDGFVQDPDVLDTWFSSALWPHSTLGWPEQTADLAKWYPTSVLLTGRDIITLWVARMVMMGMYNMGRTNSESRMMNDERKAEEPASPISSFITHHSEFNGIPFSHVAINPTILDGKGERMSKSKGNGVDPVDVIETHGADALRFTLTTMATETQDVRMPVKKLPDGRNTSDKFDLGRNFCNKLWNACRFALSNLEATTEARRHGGASGNPESSDKPSSTESNPDGQRGTTEAPPCLRASVVTSLADRWIISRFNRTVDDANKALASYRFDQYAKVCYDFFWRDFCDWYVEAVKPAMKDPARAPQTAQVLTAVIDGALRLLHPVIPFITETIWWRLNDVRPARGLPDLLECKPSQRLIKASWPTVGAADDEAEHVFPRLQEIIGTIRNLRNEHKVDVKKTVTVSIAPPGADAVRVTLENRELIETLGTCVIKDVRENLPAPSNSVRATVNGACDVYVEGLVDEGAEAARIEKKKADLAKERGALVGRLSNESYISKAPAHLVEQTKSRLAEVEAELAKLLG
jgi:valyl-tRNA synthetase